MLDGSVKCCATLHINGVRAERIQVVSAGRSPAGCSAAAADVDGDAVRRLMTDERQ